MLFSSKLGNIMRSGNKWRKIARFGSNLKNIAWFGSKQRNIWRSGCKLRNITRRGMSRGLVANWGILSNWGIVQCLPEECETKTFKNIVMAEQEAEKHSPPQAADWGILSRLGNKMVIVAKALQKQYELPVCQRIAAYLGIPLKADRRSDIACLAGGWNIKPALNYARSFLHLYLIYHAGSRHVTLQVAGRLEGLNGVMVKVGRSQECQKRPTHTRASPIHQRHT